MEITSRNTNTLAPVAYKLLQTHGILDQSRNGPVLRLPEPLTIKLTRPTERVNFCPDRDANPFFHLLEACAILADVNDTPFMGWLAKMMLEFSDDGFTQNAFYGTRLRSKFGFDQLNAVIRNLLVNPWSRQEVALIWHPDDLKRTTKDKACNLALIFSINEHNDVVMTSLNRSNDAIWGMVSGANVVHLSLIHEYVAQSVGRPCGAWFHFSNNFHIYTSNPKWQLIKDKANADLYTATGSHIHVSPFSYSHEKLAFDQELLKAVTRMVEYSETGAQLPAELFAFQFIRDAVVMFNVYQLHKQKATDLAGLVHQLSFVVADDWRWAAIAWLARRHVQVVKEVVS